MPKHLKQLSEEVLDANPYWTYKHDTYEKPNGEVGNYWYGECPGTVLIVPILPNESVVLTLQYRYLTERQSVEFPAGKVQPDISLLDSAKKELLEETGCVAEKWVSIGAFEETNGVLKSTTHVFLAYVDGQVEQVLDDTEEIDVLHRRPDELQQMIERNEITDGLSLAAWSLVRHYFIA